MSGAMNPAGNDHQRNIHALSQQLHLSPDEVGAAYQETLQSIVANARIDTFVGVLALNGTRTRLRSRCSARPAPTSARH